MIDTIKYIFKVIFGIIFILILFFWIGNGIFSGLDYVSLLVSKSFQSIPYFEDIYTTIFGYEKSGQKIFTLLVLGISYLISNSILKKHYSRQTQ